MDSETVDGSGSTASDTTKLKDKHSEGDGETYKIVLTVSDEGGNTESATNYIRLFDDVNTVPCSRFSPNPAPTHLPAMNPVFSM